MPKLLTRTSTLTTGTANPYRTLNSTQNVQMSNYNKMEFKRMRKQLQPTPYSNQKILLSHNFLPRNPYTLITFLPQ